jgi:hypothetical protein
MYSPISPELRRKVAILKSGRHHQKSYPGKIVPQKKIGYDVSMQEKSYSSILVYEFSRRICIHQILGTTSPGENFCHFSYKILGMTSPEKKQKTLPFSVAKSWIRVTLSFLIINYLNWVRVLLGKT